jgi:hypothetical protein
MLISTHKGVRIEVKKIVFPCILGAAILAVSGWSFAKLGGSIQAKSTITVHSPKLENNTPKIIRFDTTEKAQAHVQDQQNNEWLNGVENLTITKTEFSKFEYFLDALNKDKNKSNSYYADNNMGTIYAYSKYFQAQETDPIKKADEQSLMDQVKKIILSNKDPKEVQAIKDLINQLDAKYKNYSPEGSYKGLSNDYKKLADLAKNYQLPKSNILPRSSGLYDLNPNLVLYKNGYGFDKTTGQVIENVLLKGQTTINPPTKDQYFGVIEQKINGLIDKVEAPKDLKGFEKNINDIQLKLNEIHDAKKYTGDYPLIQSKLDLIELTLEDAEMHGHSDQSLDKAIKFYNNGVLEGQELYHAIQVGQSLRNASN